MARQCSPFGIWTAQPFIGENYKPPGAPITRCSSLPPPRVFGRPFVGSLYAIIRLLSVLSVLSVTLVYCGLTVGCIRMPLGMEVGLGSGQIVLVGDPAPPKTGTAAPTFRSMSTVAKRSHISATAELLSA